MTPSIYLHIPFCTRKCPYCSFAVVIGQEHRASDYLHALRQEAKAYAGTEVLSVYVGGGTPSLLSDESLGLLGHMFHEDFNAQGKEWTIEVNPEGMTPARARQLHAIGFNRVSLGAQSFNAHYLAALGRAHQPDDARRAVAHLRAAGFDNISVDLMFGFAGQTMDELDADIDAVVALDVPHVSIYALTIEPRSMFHVRGQQVSDELQAELYRCVCARMQHAGLLQYEVSNFARDGYAALHNLNYWQGGDYIGLGMAAHAHLNGIRSWNADTFPLYMAMMAREGHAVAGREILPPSEKMMETFLFGLRMNQGVDRHALQERFGCAFTSDKVKVFEFLIEAGLLTEEGARIRATDRGRLLLDEISSRLI